MFSPTISSPITPSPRIGVGVLILNTDNCLLLGKRKNSHGATLWGPAGGHLEFRETPEECAIRETKEETNLDISNPQFLAFTNDFFENEQKHYISILMTAKIEEAQSPMNLEPHKTESWEWFSLSKLPNNLFSPLKQYFSGTGYESLNQHPFTTTSLI